MDSIDSVGQKLNSESYTWTRTKLCFVVSSPGTAISFLNGHINHLSKNYDITVVCKFDGNESGISSEARVKNLNISRKLSPISDLKAVWLLRRFLRSNGFQIVHSVTPKAGIISAVASWASRTPIRIHWFTGQVWILSKGLKRTLLKNLDRLIGLLNTMLLVDSPSQREFLLSEHIISPSKSRVLGSGSIAGVDMTRFRPDSDARLAIREKLNIPDPEDLVVLFVGRLNRDKGVDTLLDVFASGNLYGNPYLVMVGNDEEQYMHRISELLGPLEQQFRYVRETSIPEKYMAAADIFCLPSFREGFGLSIIEAGAVGLPTVASRIYGITDAVSELETGLLSRPGDKDELHEALNTLLKDSSLRFQLGAQARQRVGEKWRSRELEQELELLYKEKLGHTANREVI